MATGSTLRAPGSNKSERISTARSSHQVAGTQVEIPKIVLEGIASRAMTGAPAEAPATKEPEKYVDTAEGNFKIDLNYNLRQQVTKLSDSDGESLSSMHGGGVNGLYTATPRLKTG